MVSKARLLPGKVGINLTTSLAKLVKTVNLKAEHIDKIVAIEKVAFPTPWSKEAFKHELNENPLAHYVVALLEGEVIGYGGMWQVVDEGHITNVAVDIPYRGNNLGGLIMDKLIEKAKALGCSGMTLEVRTSNLVAQKLYKSRNFLDCGLRKGYYTDTLEDAIIMWKQID